jgi:hypothetical protein
METSFAPSPIESVIYFFYLLANATTSAFYFGETQQHITELANRPNKKNIYEIVLSSRAKTKVGPSIIIAKGFL